MSGVTNSIDMRIYAKEKYKCTLCNASLTFPFLYWEDGYRDRHGFHITYIALCNHCCAKIKKGFMADLIQCAATAELNALGYGVVLERTTSMEIEETAKLVQSEVHQLRGK